ncbi:hypothetical protein [Phosphitispora fastidiosa]|uniref:hypothetical protein n=1 Tax=Phosphitispora fastidiosa TaxID=2837202 RepID=UPI001E5E2F3C|nr:hypothetical protein [Phosphitispora fastidiosa]MBU7006296.1 hypothetical protein [Phosphitispora fastidiosa]
MYVQVNDGVVVFATHFIRTSFPGQVTPKKLDTKDKGVRQKLTPFQLENDGIVVYSAGDVPFAEAMLQEMDVLYQIEPLDYEVYKSKASGIKYASRTEAIKHLAENAEPESEIIPRLKKQLAEAEAKLAEKDIRLNALESKFSVIEKRINKGGL